MSARKAEPLSRLYEQWKAAEKRYENACIAVDRAEERARKRGLDVDDRIGFVVGSYHCISVGMIKQAGKEAGFSVERIEELVVYFRKQQSEARKRRAAAGLTPLEREKASADAEWHRCLAAIARARARSVEGLAVKLQLIKRDVTMGESSQAKRMVSTALADALRLAKQETRR